MVGRWIGGRTDLGSLVSLGTTCGTALADPCTWTWRLVHEHEHEHEHVLKNEPSLSGLRTPPYPARPDGQLDVTRHPLFPRVHLRYTHLDVFPKQNVTRPPPPAPRGPLRV
jgi:hypothetical protein